MGSRISDVLYIIDKVKVLDGHFRINQHQCKRLVGFYNRLGQILHQLREYFSHQTLYSLPSFDAIISVLQKGQFLLEKYTKEDWFESMVTAGVNQDSFVAIHVELEACIRSIYAEVVKYQGLASLAPLPLMNLEMAAPLLFLDEDDRASLFIEDAEVVKVDGAEVARIEDVGVIKVEGIPSSTMVSLMNLETVAPLLSLDEEVRATLFKGDAEKDKKHMLEKIESMKTATSNVRNSNLTMKQKASKISSLDMASEKISETNDQQSATGTGQLPSYLRIESSEIKLLDYIGSGGSAEVYKCRWLHREYAVKIFRSGDVVGLRKEVENLIPLRHPNIVLLVGFSIRESDLCPMVVMELLDCDLRSLIQTDFGKVTSMKRWRMHSRQTTISKSKIDPFPIEVAIDFMYQIATGMAYIHKKKLFHGDLKAMNVLVKRHQSGLNDRSKWRYELKISDFGLSDKLVLKESHTGSDSDCTSFTTANVGTTRWRAPEVFDATDGELKPYSMKADVYSFAMTCVEVLTRQVPFHYLPTKEIRKHVQAGRRPHLPLNLLENLQKLIVRCWDQDPGRRPDFTKICTYMQKMKGMSKISSFPVLVSLDMEELEDLLDLEPNMEEIGVNHVFQTTPFCGCNMM